MRPTARAHFSDRSRTRLGSAGSQASSWARATSARKWSNRTSSAFDASRDVDSTSGDDTSQQYPERRRAGMPEVSADETFEVATAGGPARVRVALGGRTGLLCLGHGAGGGTDAPDLVAVTAAAASAGWTVARIDQPYRVAGRRAPAPAPRLDEAWITVVAALRGRFAAGLLVTGGRRSGAPGAPRAAPVCGAAAGGRPALPPGPPPAPR